MVHITSDASAYDPSQDGFTPLPPADYPCVITETNIKEGKNGNMLEIKHEVSEGQYKGRTFFNFLNLWNNSDDAKRIAWNTLFKIQTCLDKKTIQNTDELHYKAIIVKLDYQKDNPQYNRVLDYKKAGIHVVARTNGGDDIPFNPNPTPQPTAQPTGHQAAAANVAAQKRAKAPWES